MSTLQKFFEMQDTPGGFAAAMIGLVVFGAAVFALLVFLAAVFIL